MTEVNGTPLVDGVDAFTDAAQALTLAIDRDIRQRGAVDLLALKGECVMLRLLCRTLIELLAKHGTVQLSEWDKVYTAAIVRETKRICNAGVRIAVADALAIPKGDS